MSRGNQPSGGTVTLVGMDAHTRVLSLCVAEWRHGSDPEVKQAEMVAKGEADGFVSTGVDSDGTTLDGVASMRILQQFRKSAPIGADGTLLFVSGKDASFATNVVAAYEAGIRRIDANGQRRRIVEYYGMQYEPLKAR